MKRIRGVYLRGDVAYIRFKNEEGKIVRESTGQPFIEVAQAILDKRRGEVAESRFLPTRKFQKVMFRELLKTWWENHGRHTRSAFKYLKPRIENFFAGMKVAEISDSTIRSFLDRLEQSGYSNAYINSHRTLLNSVFSYAVQTGAYDKNPVLLVQPKHEQPRDRLIDPATEWPRLAKECQADAELWAFVLVAATTTARKNEILQRKWTDVDLDGENPYIRIPRTKNDDPKILPLPPAAVEALRRLPSYGKNEYLFPRTRLRKLGKNPLSGHRWDIRNDFVQACRRAGLDNVHIHDLRHLGPSILLQEGVSDSLVARITGHRSAALRRYQHLIPGLRIQTTNLIAQVLARDSKSTPTGTRHLQRKKHPARRTRKERRIKGLHGRPVGIRTPDLYRVKVAL